MSSIHNPSQFQPQDYRIVDYFDNQPPKAEHFFMGTFAAGAAEAFNGVREAWLREKASLFPEGNCYHCEHCGNGNVRYVIATDHIPTGKRVCFGNTCVVRLGFANQNEFKMAQLEAKAKLGHERMKVYLARQNYLAANPAIVVAIEQAQRPEHASNAFVRDVISKLDRYGSLSERQAAAVIKSLARDLEMAERKKNEPKPSAQVPIGRAIVQGEVVSTKTQEGHWGTSFKMLVKLTTGSKIWCTCPSGVGKGDTIELKGDFEPSNNDPYFGFCSRPRAKVLKSAVAA